MSFIECSACGDFNSSESVFCKECGSNLQLNRIKERSNSQNINFSKDKIAKVKRKMQIFEQMDDIYPDLINQQNQINALKKELNSLKREKDKQKSITLKELQDYKKYEGITLTSLFAKLRGKRDKKLEKEEEEYILAKEKLETIRAEINFLEKQLKQAKQELITIQKLYDQQISLDREIKELLTELYKGVSHPKEDMFEDDFHDLSNKLREYKIQLSIMENARSHLSSGKQFLRDCLANLRSALGKANWDTFGGGFLANSMKRKQWGYAKTNLQKANSEFEIAKRIFPELPTIYVVDYGKSNFFLDVLFDNIFTDIRSKNKIKKEISFIERHISEVTKVITQLSKQIGNLKDQITLLNKKVKDKSDKLRDIRYALLEKINN